MKIDPPYPSEESHPVINPLGKTVEETGDELIPLPNLNTIIMTKYGNIL